MTAGQPSDPPSRPSLPAALESEVLRAIDAAAEKTVIDRLCGEHPEHADAIRSLAATKTEPTPSQPHPPLPERIGPYRILERLGAGAMGTVYLAEQEEPVRQRVALKLTKYDVTSTEHRARFELERQALAVMNHEAIAKIFHAGTTETGQSYFAMELVEGLPVTDYCDKHRLSLRERIELFQQICGGVQHAHQKGVIHRDLKPGNILVARKDAKAAAKILDFGLAKATSQEFSAHPRHTVQGRLLGTPEYMAPEQASPDAEAIDARADIYSLGVILYELLTGDLPFSTHKLLGAGIESLQRTLRDEEPPKPSTKLTSTGARASELAARRRISTNTLAKQLRGDLDWIVLMAIAKEPERRYDSASALAADLERYLKHEPVVAGRPSTSYRLRKFVQRNRVLVSSSAAVLLAILAGLVASLLLYRLAAEAQHTAEARLTNYNRLRDLVSIGELKRRAEEELWPEIPEKSSAMKTWLEDAQRIREGMPANRQFLAELRNKATEWTTEEQQRGPRHPPGIGRPAQTRNPPAGSRGTSRAGRP